MNIIASPTLPTFSERTSSAMEEQSDPKPKPSFRSFIKCGFGAALTAKNSRKPLFHAKAALSRLAFSRIAFAS